MGWRPRSLSRFRIPTYARVVQTQRVTRGAVASVLAAALILSLNAVATGSADAATRRFVGGWIPYWSTDASLQSFAANKDVIGDISPFWHSLTGDTTVSDQETATDRDRVIGAARSAGIPVVPAITDGTGTGRLAAALANPARRATVVQTMVNLVASRGYDGLDLDLEGFAYSDPRTTWATTRPNWVAFVAALSAQLHARGKVLFVTIPPTYDSNRASTSGYWVYDYAGIARHVDRVRLMGYDYSVGSPGPIAPYDWVKRIVAYAVTQIPAGKVVLGIPTYGRDWVTAVTGKCPAGTNPATRSVTSKAAWQLAADKRAAVTWDATARERTFTYADRFADAATACTVARKVYFSDGAAVAERARLYHTHQLRGVALWTIGGEDASTFPSLRSLANGQGYPLSAGQVLEVQVAGGSTGVPSTAEAVSLNVTVTQPNGQGYLTVYPCGRGRPATSNVNYTAGQTVANNVTVGVGSGGKVCVYTLATAHVVVDYSGYFPSGSPFAPRTPTRLLDTRSGAKPATGAVTAVSVPAGIAAAALSIAVTLPSQAGWVSAYPCGTAWPGTSTMNFGAGQTIAGSAIVKPGANGKVCIRTSAPTHFAVDLMGVFNPGTGFSALTPKRVADSRGNPGSPIPALKEFAVSPGVAGTAVALNITVPGNELGGWVQAYPCGTAPPSTSTVNYAPGQPTANAAIVKIGSNGKVCLRGLASTHMVVDRVAAFGPGSGYYVSATPKRLADTRKI